MFWNKSILNLLTLSSLSVWCRRTVTQHADYHREGRFNENTEYESYRWWHEGLTESYDLLFSHLDLWAFMVMLLLCCNICKARLWLQFWSEARGDSVPKGGEDTPGDESMLFRNQICKWLSFHVPLMMVLTQSWKLCRMMSIFLFADVWHVTGIRRYKVNVGPRKKSTLWTCIPLLDRHKLDIYLACSYAKACGNQNAK